MTYPVRTGALVLACLAVAGCGGGKAARECGTPAYTQDFETPVGSIVVTWGNDIKGNASAFLVNRKKGIFMTADHVVDAMRKYSKSTAPLFFNGNVYTITVIKVLPLDDVALVQVTCSFDSVRSPEPFPLASAEVRIGDSLFVMGIHKHPHSIRAFNAKRGVADRVLPIIAEYFGIVMADPTRESEMVFDSLASVVGGLGIHAPSMDPANSPGADALEVMRDTSNAYIWTRTVRDHKFSFGGLSGGPVLNARGELVGVVTKEGCDPRVMACNPNAYENVFVSSIRKREFQDLLSFARSR